MAEPKTLNTWKGGPEQFQYVGSVATGTHIRYGAQFAWTVNIDAADYQRLLKRFSGQLVMVGTSKDKPPAGSVGEWVKANITRSGLMSYIGAILVEERYATKPKPGWIQFTKTSS